MTNQGKKQGKKVIVCDKCGTKFLVKSVNINECSVEIGSEMLLLKYFTCPKCNEIYRVLFVNEQEYKMLVNDLMLAEKRIHKQEGNGNVYLFDQLQKMALRKKVRLQNYVKGMNKRYQGTFTFVTSENNDEEIRYLP